MSFGGPNPHQPWQPNGGPGPYQPWQPNGGYPPPQNPGPYPPQNPGPYPPPNPGPYVPPQPGPTPPPYGPYPPHPGPYVPQPQPTPWQRLREDEWPPLRELLRARGQRGIGCVQVVLLFTCVSYLVLPLMVLYPMARSARRRARRIFPVQHRRILDPDLVQAQRVRAWTAAVMSFLILVAYGKPEDFEQARDQYMMRLTITPWLLLLSAPVVVTLLMRWAPPDARPEMRRRLRAAGRSTLWYFGAFTLVPLLAVGAGLIAQRYARESGGAQSHLVAVLALVMLLVMLWALLFVVFASGPAMRSAFNTSEVHPALPALLTGILVWEFAAIGLAAAGPPPGPPLVQICALLGGPVSVTAVAWWEIHRLRTRHRVTLRA